MTTKRFVRPPRVVAGPKSPAVTELRLEPPTELPRPMPTPKWRLVMPLVMVGGVGGMMVMMFRSGAGSASPMMLFFPLMILGSMAGMLGGMGGKGKSSGELNEDRKDYLRSIGDNRRSVLEADRELHTYLEYAHPGPSGLGRLVGSKRMWEVQAASPQFLRVRVGLGRIANQVRVIVPEAAPTADLDPVGVVELTRFAKAYSTVGGMPIAVNLLSAPLIGLDGDPDAMAGLMRAMVAEIVLLHGPDQVSVAAAIGDPEAPEWNWLKWLPHTQHDGDSDAIGTSRMVYRSVAELRTKVVAGLNRGPFSANAKPGQDRKHYVLIADSAAIGNDRDISGVDGCTWLRLGTSGRSLARAMAFTVSPDRELTEISSRGSREVGTADHLTVESMVAIARSLSPYRLSTVVEAVTAAVQATGQTWPEMVGVADPGAIDLATQWAPRRDADRARLNIPFAWDPAGGLVYLDIKESAEEGMGPHGMCIGATGSGKSEFLRTLVMSAVAAHSPDVLNMLLVDFKGGATFLGFDRLSHVTAVVTNMEEESDLVTRMEDVLTGEMSRRQRILRDAGNFASVADYERAREQGARLTPMPTLLVVLDEFAELLEQFPDFAKLFAAIGRLGRSLRIHLLLASQKVPASRMGELEAHLSYRIALRTNQTSDSRDAIGTADAYHLPKKPGAGYLRVGSGELQRFQAAYVGSPYIAPVRTPAAGRRQARQAAGANYIRPRLFTTADIVAARPRQAAAGVAAVLDAPESEQVTLMETVLHELSGHGRPAHKMWLPPLNMPISLDRLLSTVTPGTLRVPWALIDRPRQQSQDVWTVDLSGAGGHAAVVGAPQSGKSTALQTLILAAALTHTPEQVQFYCLDFSGGALGTLRRVPHVGSVATSRDNERIRRTIALVTSLINTRQDLFSELNVDSMREYRRRKEAEPGLLSRDPYGDVFLVIDGWDIAFAPTGTYYDEYMSVMESIALQGLNYGIHLIVGSSRWGAIRPNVKDLIATRMEMRLGDVTDTVYNQHRNVVRAIPENQPGRCISNEGLHMLAALPRIDGIAEADSVSAGLNAAIDELVDRYGVRRAPEVRLLPDQIALAEVRSGWPAPTNLAERLRVPFGLRESDLGPAFMDFGVSTHFVVLGSSGSGKSTVLSTFLESILSQCDPSQARFVLIDYRRTHLEAVPDDMLIGHWTSEADIRNNIEIVLERIRGRRPPDGITARQLAERSWWIGPEVFVVIDDYHMIVQRGMSNPLEPLSDVIVDGRDTGLHVIAARNIAQADMALYDNVLGQIKNVNSSGFIMDGAKSDGALIGNIQATKQPVGRGIFIEPMRSAKDLVQSARPAVRE